MSLSTTIKAQISGTHTRATDIGTATFPLSLINTISLSDGTAANQADKIFHDTRTLSASATEDLDFSGALTDSFGQTVTFARIKAIMVVAASGNTNNVNVTRPAANGVPLFLAASDGVAVRPGGVFLLSCSDATGVPVTAGTGDLLTFTNSAGTTGVDYTLIVIGASA